MPRQTVQRGLLRAMAFVVDRGAIRRLQGSPADGFLARDLDVVSQHGVKPRAPSQSLRVPSACVCLLLRGLRLHRGPWHLPDRPLLDDEFSAADVADGSSSVG